MKKAFFLSTMIFLMGMKLADAQQLASANGKATSLPYSQMALTAKFIGPAINDTGWFS